MAEYEDRADELEKQADKMEEESERVSGSIGDARDEWEANQADQTVPGAQEDLEKILDPEDEGEDEE
jgi:phage shock protein A